ncbi:arsenic metallochaperone ArsD family protein [Rothia nasimurium]|uniref:arsenic metallochaperone ArsD family protein n=1 Tax=Rothia nasimurium TaxID=85336 RepID=UPI001F482B5C|nr:arsenic metallochaperone ArsD family protein [Rothia nasimurium]
MARIPKDALGATPLEVFIPGPGQNPDDPGDTAREAFLAEAQELLDQGLDIAVYSPDSYPSAFTDCEPVADQIAMAGVEVLPILLVEGLVKVSYMYPTGEQLRRFSHFGEVKQPKVNAAAAACGTGGTEAPATAPAVEPAGFAAVLAGVTPRPAGGPDMGDRVNLLDGHGAAGAEQTGGCCGGSCGCGH